MSGHLHQTARRENRIVAQDSETTVVKQIEIRRFYTRQMREEAASGHMAEISKSVGNGWKLQLQPINEAGHWYLEIENRYPSDVAFNFTLTGPKTDRSEIDAENILSNLVAKLRSIKTGSADDTGKYRIHLVDGIEWKPRKAIDRINENVAASDGAIPYANVTMPPAEDVPVYFRKQYDSDPQINMVVRKMRRAIENEFEYRDHCLLTGDPGCGKSYTLQLAAKMFGKDAVLWLDGTSMTSAGIIELLKQLTVMPRFIFVEEIDKSANDAVAVLLGVMDKRGEVRKTTYRDNIQRDARVCVFATANNMDKVRKMQEGALYSRFGNPVTYNRPSESALKRILNRELDDLDIATCVKNNRNSENEIIRCEKCKECIRRAKWIAATLDWCKNNQNIMESDTLDPRFVIQMCINGQDDLLNGSYQRDIEATSPKLEDFDK